MAAFIRPEPQPHGNKELPRWSPTLVSHIVRRFLLVAPRGAGGVKRMAARGTGLLGGREGKHGARRPRASRLSAAGGSARRGAAPAPARLRGGEEEEGGGGGRPWCRYRRGSPGAAGRPGSTVLPQGPRVRRRLSPCDGRGKARSGERYRPGKSQA